jgi:hypothetical protein
MKKVVFILVLILFAGTVSLVNAQDIITKKDGTEISAKVTEVNSSDVKYKMYGEESGPTYTLPKSQIFMIVYKVVGGDDIKEMFNTPEISSPDPDPQPQPQTEKVRKWFVDGGISVLSSGDSYFGIAISAGYYFSPNDRLSLDFSSHFSEEQIGTFSYTWNDENFYDGKISRHCNFSPILLSWGHEFKLSQKVKLRAGPSIGINRLSAYDDYTTKSHDVTKISGIPDKRRVSESLFVGGAILGLEWRLFKPSGLGFSYGILAGKATTFDNVEINAITHLIRIGYWWKF